MKSAVMAVACAAGAQAFVAPRSVLFVHEQSTLSRRPWLPVGEMVLSILLRLAEERGEVQSAGTCESHELSTDVARCLAVVSVGRSFTT